MLVPYELNQSNFGKDFVVILILIVISSGLFGIEVKKEDYD